MSLVRRRGPWLAVLAVAAAAYYPRFVKDPSAMLLYPQAADCLRGNQAMLTCAPDFTYPPALALLMLPLAPMPLWLRNLVWYLITIAAIVGAFRLCELLARRLYPGPWTQRELLWLRVASVLLTSKFVLAVLENQAHDALPLLLMLGGLIALAASRPLAGGAALGCAAAIKATPLLFLPYLILKGRLWAAGAFALSFLALGFAPDALYTPAGAEHGYFLSWAQQIAAPALRSDVVGAFWSGFNLLNHSLRGVVARQISDHTDPALFRMVLITVWSVLVLVLGWLLLKSPRRQEMVAVDGALLLIGMLMLSPMTSRSHYIVLMLPYCLLAAAVIRDTRMRRIGLPMLVASFLLTTATSNDLVGSWITELAYRQGHLVIGALLLVVGMAAIIARRAADEEVAARASVPPRRRDQRLCQTSSDATT
jgi:hypothetical protein